MRRANSALFGFIRLAILLVLTANGVSKGENIQTKNEIDPALLKNVVANAEHALKNLRVSFNVKGQLWNEKSGKLQRGTEARGTAWYDGIPGGKAKIQFDDLIQPWINGKSDFFESQSALAFDGKFGLQYDKAGGSLGSLHDVFSGRITAGRPILLPNYSSFMTGWGYSLYGIFDFSEKHERLSDYIGPAGLSDYPVEYVKSVCEQTPCIEITLYYHTGSGEIFDLDPARSYALLRHEHFFKSGLTSQRWLVKSFIEAAPGIFFPKEAEWESDNVSNPKAIVPRSRVTYTASEVIANDPAFPADAFEIKWPSHTRIQDDVAGMSYVTGQSDAGSLK